MENNNLTNNYNIVIIGCGHAGLEAALIATKMCPKVAIVIVNKANVGRLSCNPSVGGISKSHLVSEVSCMGGLIGSISDKTALVSQMLNANRNKSSSSLRLQVDKRLYALLSIKVLLESGIKIIEETATQIRRCSEGFEISLTRQNLIRTKMIVLAAGTAARSMCHIGDCSLALDRLTDKSNDCVYNFLKANGISFKRFKTGTSPRIKKASIKWTETNTDKSKPSTHGFCKTLNKTILKMHCKWTHTNENTHKTITNNMSKASSHIGRLLASSPRYCMSIEEKALRFKNKPQKLVIEPESVDSNSAYINGLSTSMPIEIQLLVLAQINAFKSAKVTMAGYATEYDSVCSNELSSTLECFKLPGVFAAGQINGTTGYEEASAQGFVAGLNAAAAILKKRKYTLNRKFSYTGTLIADITQNALSEPYRMLSTRSKNRAQLKQRNSILRLLPYSLSINALTRQEQSRQASWAGANKRLALKLLTNTDTVLNKNEKLAISKRLSQTWQKLTLRHWEN
ncbi:FAD-dependent oxidoreductase [Candidatus Hodgkinia cicadicola]